jgi:hypothetical protein
MKFAAPWMAFPLPDQGFCIGHLNRLLHDSISSTETSSDQPDGQC